MQYFRILKNHFPVDIPQSRYWEIELPPELLNLASRLYNLAAPSCRPRTQLPELRPSSFSHPLFAQHLLTT